MDAQDFWRKARAFCGIPDDSRRPGKRVVFGPSGSRSGLVGFDELTFMPNLEELLIASTGCDR